MIKKYKVVCSQPKFSDKIYIDIAPNDGVIHDQIFFSRIMLHRQIDNQPLERLYGSIYLSDDDGSISVEFPKPQARKNSLEYHSILKQYESLTALIKKQYNDMKHTGAETTLYLYSVNQMFELSESKNAEADAFERKSRAKRQQIEDKTGGYMQKHTAQIHPQTLKEEQQMQLSAELSAARERRIIGKQNRALRDEKTNPIDRMKAKMQQYSGD